MVNILIGCTGSVATIKLPLLIQAILEKNRDVKVNVVLTKSGEHFVRSAPLTFENVRVFTDDDEWASWDKRGDPVLHIELVKWADIFIVAPLSANSLAKLANGLCDNLLTCIARAWDTSKPLIFCPAMNTKMYEHVLTKEHIDKLLSWGYQCIPVIEKTLMCGDTGLGAMAEVDTIVEYLDSEIKKKS
ncbi:phosphopantothenoylcysteine decarboxylase [Harmonia axyridis]|uniref:phosphopantothenoylcysteine decarboxylase n=1 Tax=Harmonia axyridis TaxID=115357 RepID=UPI001E275782|nr:phosphopantothenoylcysteine decarboxylase [Harmonia axyridis]